MTDPEELKRSVSVCMFDQYGTVVDMQGGLREVAAEFLKAKGWKGDPNAFVTWWRRTHFENSMIDALLQREHTSYRAIGELSVAQVMDRAGIAHTDEEVRGLVAAIERLKPFPEVPAALDRLRTRYRLAVLSNGDPDMLEEGQAPPRHRLRGADLGRRGGRHLQAAPRHLHEGGGAPRRPHRAGAVRRQPRIRRGRRQGRRNARRLHRPPPPPLRPLAAPAGPDRAEHDGAGRRHRLTEAGREAHEARKNPCARTTERAEHPPNAQERGGPTAMEFGYFSMPSHPPERGLKAGHDFDLQTLRWLDELGFTEAWIGEHHTAPWEPHPAPDLLIAQALLQTEAHPHRPRRLPAALPPPGGAGEPRRHARPPLAKAG